MHRLLHSDLADTLGFSTVIGSIGLAIGEYLNIMNVNDVLQFLVTSGGLVFLYYKIKTIRLEYKIKKEDYGKSSKK